MLGRQPGTPTTPQAQNQTLRLITEEKVAALICGCYQSAITVTASAVAEKYGIPVPVQGRPRRSAGRSWWFFRTTPVSVNFAKAYADFLKEQRAAGQKIRTIAIVHENTEYGTSTAGAIADLFAKEGLNVDELCGEHCTTSCRSCSSGEEPQRR